MFTGRRDNLIYILLPLFLASTVYIAFWLGKEPYYYWVQSPLGFLENFTALMVLVSAAISTQTAFLTSDKKLRGWLLVYALCGLFFAGEDVNWGQYFWQALFNWEVPQYFIENNEEQETNLHNMSSWFNQKPRVLMTIWIVVAGILVPLGWDAPKRWTRNFVPAILWPDRRLLPVAVMAMAVRLPEQVLRKGLGMHADWMQIRHSEIQELFFGYFMLMYIVLVRRQLRAENT